MAKPPLHQHFSPEVYEIKPGQEPGLIDIVISGRRVGRPSRRLVLHQHNLKIEKASLKAIQKNKSIDYDVDRINHLPTFQQVRLHTKQLQYPGFYKISLSYRGTVLMKVEQAFAKSENRPSLRGHFPSIDEPEAEPTEINFK